MRIMGAKRRLCRLVNIPILKCVWWTEPSSSRNPPQKQITSGRPWTACMTELPNWRIRSTIWSSSLNGRTTRYGLQLPCQVFIFLLFTAAAAQRQKFFANYVSTLVATLYLSIYSTLINGAFSDQTFLISYLQHLPWCKSSISLSI